MVRDVAYNAETDDFTVTVKGLEKDEVNRCFSHGVMSAALSFRARICKRLKVHKREKFFVSDFEFFTIL